MHIYVAEMVIEHIHEERRYVYEYMTKKVDVK